MLNSPGARPSATPGLGLGVGVGVTVGSGWTNAPEHVPSYDAPLRVTVHGAPFSNTEFAVIDGEVAA